MTNLHGDNREIMKRIEASETSLILWGKCCNQGIIVAIEEKEITQQLGFLFPSDIWHLFSIKDQGNIIVLYHQLSIEQLLIY